MPSGAPQTSIFGVQLRAGVLGMPTVSMASIASSKSNTATASSPKRHRSRASGTSRTSQSRSKEKIPASSSRAGGIPSSRVRPPRGTTRHASVTTSSDVVGAFMDSRRGLSDGSCRSAFAAAASSSRKRPGTAAASRSDVARIRLPQPSEHPSAFGSGGGGEEPLEDLVAMDDVASIWEAGGRGVYSLGVSRRLRRQDQDDLYKEDLLTTTPLVCTDTDRFGRKRRRVVLEGNGDASDEDNAFVLPDIAAARQENYERYKAKRWAPLAARGVAPRQLEWQLRTWFNESADRVDVLRQQQGQRAGKSKRSSAVAAPSEGVCPICLVGAEDETDPLHGSSAIDVGGEALEAPSDGLGGLIPDEVPSEAPLVGGDEENAHGTDSAARLWISMPCCNARMHLDCGVLTAAMQTASPAAVSRCVLCRQAVVWTAPRSTSGGVGLSARMVDAFRECCE